MAGKAMGPYRSKNDLLNVKTKENRWTYLKFGRVVRVDTSRMVMDIEWLFEPGGRNEVPIASPYFHGNSFLGAVPDEKAIGIFGWHDFDGVTAQPLPLAYLPQGVVSGHNNVAFKEYNDNTGRGWEETFRFRHRNLRPGDIYASHKSGSDLLMNEDVLLSNSALNEIWMRSADQSLLMNSVNRYEFTDGTKSKTGLIYRNAYVTSEGRHPIYPQEFDNLAQDDQQEDLTIDGRAVYIVTRGGSSPDDYGEPFIEHRLVINEFGDNVLDVNEEMFGVDGEQREDGGFFEPLIVDVKGTVVGDDPDDPKRYGRVLKPRLFTSPLAEDGVFQMTPVDNDSLAGREESSTLAAATYLSVGRNYQHTVTKEGTVSSVIGRSSAGHSLGQGVSAEYLYQGSIKMAVGANGSRARSVEASFDGGLDLRIGADKDNVNKGTQGRSLNVRAQAGLDWTVLNPDAQGNAWSTSLRGNEFKFVEGNSLREVTGNEVSVIQGLIDENIIGKKSVKVAEDFAVSAGGNISLVTASQMKTNIGQGREETINTGGDSLTINQGDKITTVSVGTWRVDVDAGNWEANVTTGNMEQSVTTGNWSAKVTTGNLNLEVTTGNIKAKTQAGTAQMEASLPVTIKSDVKITAQAPTVDLGQSATGGVITDTTHRDYIVGIPLQSSKTIKASN